MVNKKDICPRAEKCPLFTGLLEKNKRLKDAYKNIYCNAGEEGRNNCKRFIVAEETGECPPDILPNSSKSVEDIIEAMHNKQVVIK